MYRLLRPLLFWLDPERAHRLGLLFLRVAQRPPFVWMVRWAMGRRFPRLQTRFLGMDLPNPIGLAAGLDKDGVAAAGLAALGFGLIEVGTVTPRPQPGNPRPRLFRLPLDRALVNRMGFNNRGADALARRLGQPRPCAVGVNLGKNKDTPPEAAADDYLAAYQRLQGCADYWVINVSSPNTPGLRDLQSAEALERIVRPILALRDACPQERRAPILVKLAPDLADDDAIALGQACQAWGVDGLVVSNTTIARRDLRSPPALASEPGGLSGAPLEERSTELVRLLAQRVKLPIVGVGGVCSAADAYRKIRAGASVVQVYTGLIYGGPGFVRELCVGLDALLQRDGFATVADAVGADLREPGVTAGASRR